MIIGVDLDAVILRWKNIFRFRRTWPAILGALVGSTLGYTLLLDGRAWWILASPIVCWALVRGIIYLAERQR